MHRHPPSLLQSAVVDRAVDSEPVVYVRLSDSIDSAQGDIKLNNNNDQQQLPSYKMPGLVEAAMSLAEEEGFLPGYSNASFPTSHQVRSGITLRVSELFCCLSCLFISCCVLDMSSTIPPRNSTLFCFESVRM
jgi:hypothetical protein